MEAKRYAPCLRREEVNLTESWSGRCLILRGALSGPEKKKKGAKNRRKIKNHMKGGPKEEEGFTKKIKEERGMDVRTTTGP